ncbi:MAG: ABC transporter permease [Chloroflexi bacterium]|nr:ABC transporter permease [Chloroflexota bacterium]
MNILLRTWAIFIVAAKRLFSQRWLALATALGLIASIALVMSVPLYADAVYYRVLNEELAEESPSRIARSHPPFAFMFRYVGAWAGSVDWEEIQPLDAYLSQLAGPALGLPQKSLVRHFKTDNFQLFPQGDIAYADIRDPLTWTSFAFVTDLENHIIIQEGRFPNAAEPLQDSTIEVMISDALALELGLQVDETYIAFTRQETMEGEQTIQITVRITGVWTPMDPEEEFWFYNTEAFDKVMIVPEETFQGRIGPYVEDAVYLGLWYLVMDGSDVTSSDAVPLLGRMAAVQQRTASLLNGAGLDISPEDALQRYQRTAGLLTFLLYAFSVPIVGLILAFVGLVVGLSVGRQRNEIAVLRSRGATAIQVVGIAALEGALLGVFALAVSFPVSEMIAHIIGRSRSFLDFTLQSDLRVNLTMSIARFGVIAVGVTLLALIVPTIGAARHTIVTFKQERARSLRKPWWQRAWLDVLLFIPAAYGAYLLRQQGSVALPTVEGMDVANNPLQNPLLLLVPALGVFALTLFILRLLPVIMTGIAWVAARTKGVGVLLAVRHLARSPGFYTAPLVLLVLTLSLSAFTASLAQTLDRHLHDQTYYRIGADMQLDEMGEDTQATGAPPGFVPPSAAEEEEPGPRWLFLPVSEHLKVPGVQAAARIGRYTANTRLSGVVQEGTFFGVDRIDFPQVAFWRQDFASVSLGALMNALALYPNGVLIPREFAAQYALAVDDLFYVSVNTHGQRTDIEMKVVGVFDLFPTWYPDDGPLIVGNLDYLFEQVGGQFPYDVWLKTDQDADYDQIAQGVRDLRLNVMDWDAPLLEIAAEQQRPERQGLFGVLSVGFMAAALLTVLGFLLYAFFSFRRRFIELGILRAIGLSAGQMTAFLAWELAFLILVGAVAGTGLGAWISELFIPYLQVGGGPSAQIPPYVVEIAWQAVTRIYVLFGALFVIALGVLVALLLRMKIFQAVKLGETA